MPILIRGAGDLASGIALRLYRAGYQVLLTEIARPLAVRWSVSFCAAAVQGEAVVEGIRARRLLDPRPEDWEGCWAAGEIPLVIDPDLSILAAFHPDALIDAILAKKNCGLSPDLAPLVIGVGPGFCAPEDCHYVIETMRGHTLGRAYAKGSVLPNTGVPGEVGGYTAERLLRAPAEGKFEPLAEIGQRVNPGMVVAQVEGIPLKAQIGGVLRGLLQKNTPVTKGLKAGDVDPRCEVFHCTTVSDKALAIAGGVLEALLQSGCYPDLPKQTGSVRPTNPSRAELERGYHAI